ncbi:MAG: SDR family oxidoreductase [bacterium]|jgi:nucleoside-diphosphate-sugar epimerase|nr:SDR family oxidoreductase [Betaproteobacteria bacterium]
MPRPCALIAGASGVVGRAVLRTLAERGDWDVVALSRSATSVSNTRAIAVDLSSADDVRDRLSPLAGITHLVYCARATHSMAKRESVDDNVDMLRNLLDALERSSPRLAHVHIVQGSKVYGSDLGPYRTPARESDPRVTPSNWYYAQEDLLVERSAGKAWTWSASRPHGVCEGRQAIARSIANMVGVYAAVLKELGQPLAFPGTQSGFDALYQSVDADLLARAIAFIVTTPACANRVFNVTNGDYVRWRNLWPAFATFFGMDTGPVQEGTTLAGFMQGKDAIWDAVVARHGLLPRPLSQAGVWSYADFNFRRGYDVMSSTIALRQAGFAECLDTERMFLDHLQRFREQRVLP